MKYLKKLFCILLSVTMIASSMGTISYAENVEDTMAEEPTEEIALDNVEESDNTKVFDESTMEEETDTFVGEDNKEDEVQEERMLTWKEFCRLYYSNYKSLSKPEKMEVHREYDMYKDNFTLMEDGNSRQKSGDCTISNPFLEVAVNSSGKYTIGNIEGNPAYTSDNHQMLLYGHPDPGTSETLIKIDNQEWWFNADSVSAYNDKVVAVMTISSLQVKVIETLEFCRTGSSANKDTVRINYKVINSSSMARSIGVRIMLDTMLADNDDAPFKISGLGNVTTVSNFSKNNVPASYQVYDDLAHPTTIATGYLKVNGERVPDRVQFTSWPGIEDSSWDYVGIVGRYLGDSAVGIYFDPVNVTSGNQISVSTYYGVSVGPMSSSAGNNQQVLSSNKVALSVKDSDNGTSISDANVEAVLAASGSKLTGKTDSNGKVTLNLPDSKEYEADLTISKTGYATRKIHQVLKGGSIISATLKNEKSANPEIKTVKIEGKDIINGVVHYIENHNSIIEKDKNAGTAKIEVTSDMDKCTYYLIQNDTVLKKNDTGVFELKTSKTSGGTLIESLKSGNLLYVKAVSNTGKSSKKVRLGIKVSLPSVSSSSILDLNLWPAGTANIAKGTVGALFLGNKVKFGLGKKLKCSIEVAENGMIKVGVNMTKLPQSVKDRQDLMDAFSKANFSKALKSIGSDYQPKKSSVSLGVVSPSFTIMGYGEGFIKEDGSAKLNVAIRVEGGVDASYTVNYYYVVPLYITIGAGGKITGEVKANLYNDSGWGFTLTHGTVSPSVYLSVEGGVGSKGVANVGVQGKGTLQYTHNFVTKAGNATLTGEANIVLGFWKFEKSLNLAKATKKIYDSNDKEGTTYYEDEPTIEELLKKEDFKLVDRSYLNTIHKEGDSSGDGMTLSAIPDAEVKTVSVNGKQYRFMIESAPGIDANGDHLVYQVYEDGYWSGFMPVDEDGTCDFFPAVTASKDGKIYIAWQNSKTLFDNETVTPQDVADAAEIRLAVMDTKNEDSLSYYNITDNNYMDSLPALVADQNGVVYLVWYANTGDILENDAEDILCYTTFANGTIGATKQKNLNGQYVSDLSVGIIGGIPTASYTLIDSLLEIDNNVQSVNTLQLSGEATEISLNQDNNSSLGKVVMESFLGNPAIYWYENGNIWYSLTGKKEDRKNVVAIDEETLENEYSTSNVFSVVDHGDKTAVIWKNSYVDEDNSGFRIFATVNEGSGWSKPFVIKQVFCDDLRKLTGSWNEDGMLTVQYIEVCYDEDGNISSSYFIDENADQTTNVSLENVVYDEKLVKSAAKLPLTLTIKNNGNEVVNEARIYLYNDYDGNSYTEAISDLNLLPGESKNITVNEYTLPEFSQDDLVTITAEVSIDNNECYETYTDFKVGYASIEVNSDETMMIDDEEYYKIKISNTGAIDAQKLRVRVLADDKDGILLLNTDIEELVAGEDTYIYLSGSGLEESDIAYIYVTSETPLGEEEEYFWPMYCSRNTMLLLGNHNIKLQAKNGGKVGFIKDGEVSYSSASEADVMDYSQTEIAAQAEEGYVFDGWSVTSGSVEDEMAQKTIFEAGNDDVVVTANFVLKTVSDAKISLNKNEVNLTVGDEESLTALSGENVTKQVIWTSSDDEIVKVSSTGKITALKAGTATVTVKDKGNDTTADCLVQISDIPVTAIKMVYPEISLPGKGEKDQVEILVTPSNATQKILYKTDREDVVTVDQTGKITAVGAGTATITAYTEDGIEADCQVEVINHLENFLFTAEDITVNKGESTNISVNFDPVDATDISDVVWTNYNSDIIEVTSSGNLNQDLTVKGLIPGTALIEANVNDMVKYCTVTVNNPATAISLDQTSLEIMAGQSVYLEPTVSPSDTTDTLYWSSSDSDVAYVDDDGEIYAYKAGKARITVETTSGLRAYCDVTVTPKQYDTIHVTDVKGFETPHNYDAYMDKVWEYSAPNAEAISLTFSEEFEFESGYDYLTILDQNGKELGRFTGTQLAGQTVTYETNLLRLLVTSDGSAQKYGFKVTRIANKYDLNKATITTKASYGYTGSAIIPSDLVVKIGTTILVKDRDYTVKGTDNINVGKATIKVTGKAPSTGSKTASFQIVKRTPDKVKNLIQKAETISSVQIAWNKVAYASGYEVYKYDNVKKKYVLYQKISGGNNTKCLIKGLKKAQDVKLYVQAYIKASDWKTKGAKTTITAATLPSKVTNCKATYKSKSGATMKWKAMSGVKGYIIYMSTSKNGKYKAVQTVKKASANDVKIAKSKLGKNKGKRYFKIRAYRNGPNKKLYGDYSSIFSVTVK